MGNSTSTAASNYASVVNNSITNIVNDVSMSCESGVTSRNGLVFITNIYGSTNVNLEVDAVQTNNAVVAAECIQNSEVLTNASAAISNSVTQYAEAVQAGFIPPPGASNTTSIVNNVSQSILNSYSSFCAAEFVTRNTAVFVTNVKESNAINATFDIDQTNSIDFISSCITDLLLDTEATQDITNIVDQTAKAESKSIIGALAVLIIALVILMAAVYVFGRSFASFIFAMFKSLALGIMCMVVAGLFVFGLCMLFMWGFGLGMFGSTRVQEPITAFDDYWDKTGQFMYCEKNMFAPEDFPPELAYRAGKVGTNIDGYTHCVDGDFREKGIYSYWCKNDTQFFANIGMDFAYYYPKNKNFKLSDPHDTVKTLTWGAVFKTLPPEVFGGMDEKYWPVSLVTANSKKIGCWPINFPKNVNYSNNFEKWRGYYNSRWLSINPEVGVEFHTRYPDLETLANVLSNSPMGVCSGDNDMTNALDFNYYATPLSEFKIPDQPEYKQIGANESGAKIYEGLESKTVTECLWSEVYLFGFMVYYKLLDDVGTNVKWIVGAPLTATANDEAAWGTFLFAGTPSTTVVTVNDNLVSISFGEVIGEALYHFRQDLYVSGYNLSAYNKAWVGDGLLRGEAKAISLAAIRDSGVEAVEPTAYIADPIWGYNERGFLCFNPDDEFLIKDVAGSNKTITARNCHFTSERSMSTAQCLRSENLANSSGASVYTFGCSDYISANAKIGNRTITGGIDTYSACCAWKPNPVGGCADYLSYKNPYRCDLLELRNSDVYEMRSVTESFGSCASAHLVLPDGSAATLAEADQQDESCTALDYVSYGTIDPAQVEENIMFLPFNPANCHTTPVSTSIKRSSDAGGSGEALNPDFFWQCQMGKYQVPMEENRGVFACENRQYRYRNLKVPTEWVTTTGSTVNAVCFPTGTLNNKRIPEWDHYFPAASTSASAAHYCEQSWGGATVETCGEFPSELQCD